MGTLEDEELPIVEMKLAPHSMVRLKVLSAFEAQVVDLVSTDPAWYLDERWQPGSVIRLSINQEG